MAAESQIGIANGNCNGSVPSSSLRTYHVVVAGTRAMGIGKNGELPWRLPSDLKFFKNLTLTTIETGKRNAIIMGRKTWESIPLDYRPLSGRLNVVLTRSESFGIAAAENVIKCGSLSSALELLASSPYHSSIERVFVIGGGEIFREALNGPGCDAIHFIDVETRLECDTFMPEIDTSMFHPWYSSFPTEENNIRYSFITYVRVRHSKVESLIQNNKLLSNGKNGSAKFEVKDFSFLPKMVFERHEEYMYLRLFKDILSNGTSKTDRTCTGTISKFGCQMRFNLRRTFPLLTTKCSGEEWLRNFYGLSAVPLMLRYTDMHADYTGQGFDQLMDVIDKIKNNPDYRQIILSAWNPSDLKLMALPPCHMFSQFYVSNGELSCQMYQRSADMGLGVPFNIASYSLLTCMIAHVCGLSPGDCIHVIGDAHVYSTHIQPLQEQLGKVPKPFPVLKINPEKKDIDSFVGADFKLIGYEPHEKIEMKMAI
ncbi:hypothetical protein MLD38_026804 [Melastoma candidum]|uniref:Uncharacterized protein n=1 Tax=Melastoma candidum TaxID=119954 RepID=A0ACB9NZJ8_9MYRT|nr:hypothetical protein MLD38_026804 [Melastoma candidum]